MREQIEQRDKVIAAELVGAARDVLNVMFFTDVMEEYPETGVQAFPLQVRVSFTGHECGEFRMEVDEEAATAMAGSFLGTNPVAAPEAEEVEEVMAELGNMICGAFLSRFESEGLFALSSPRIVRPASGAIPGIERKLELMEGTMNLRICWGQIPE